MARPIPWPPGCCHWPVPIRPVTHWPRFTVTHWPVLACLLSPGLRITVTQMASGHCKSHCPVSECEKTSIPAFIPALSTIRPFATSNLHSLQLDSFTSTNNVSVQRMQIVLMLRLLPVPSCSFLLLPAPYCRRIFLILPKRRPP